MNDRTALVDLETEVEDIRDEMSQSSYTSEQILYEMALTDLVAAFRKVKLTRRGNVTEKPYFMMGGSEDPDYNIPVLEQEVAMHIQEYASGNLVSNF